CCAGVLMEHLIFVCPAIGREIDSGVGSEIGTLLRIRQQNVRALCPPCGASHTWPVRAAFLAKAAGHPLEAHPPIARLMPRMRRAMAPPKVRSPVVALPRPRAQ